MVRNSRVSSLLLAAIFNGPGTIKNDDRKWAGDETKGGARSGRMAGHGDQAALSGSASHRNEQPRDCKQRAAQGDFAGHRNEQPRDCKQRVNQGDFAGHRNEQPSGRIIGTQTKIYDLIERELQRDNVQPTRCSLFCLTFVIGLCAAVCTAAAVHAG